MKENQKRRPNRSDADPDSEANVLKVILNEGKKGKKYDVHPVVFTKMSQLRWLIALI